MNLVEQKIDQIYEDLEANVVHIPWRENLMAAVDFAYHSVLCFQFQGDLVRKGCVESLVLGDTRVGKSATVKAMMRHYGLGDFITGESVSLAGLLGGVDESNRRRFIRYGRLPLAHKGLVAVDECNEMSIDLMSRMSGVRSDGIYTMQKIVAAKVPCLVRMIWIGNPRRRKSIGEFSYGVEAVNDLMDRPEDVARFDCAVILSHKDVDTDALYKSKDSKKKVPHRFSAELCRKRVLWAWSRNNGREDQVQINADTEERILVWSSRLAREFSDAVPLVIETEQRIKIAKLSVSKAAQVFSHDGTGEVVVVRPEHVDAACNSLLGMYRASSMGYDAFSRDRRIGGVGGDIARVLHALGRQGMRALLNFQEVSESDLKRIFGDKDAGEEALRVLVLNNGACRAKRGAKLSLTSAMNDRIKSALEDDVYAEKPSVERLKQRRDTRDDDRDWND